jgi:hypothetical protein
MIWRRKYTFVKNNTMPGEGEQCAVGPRGVVMLLHLTHERFISGNDDIIAAQGQQFALRGAVKLEPGQRVRFEMPREIND